MNTTLLEHYVDMFMMLSTLFSTLPKSQVVAGAHKLWTGQGADLHVVKWMIKGFAACRVKY